MTRTDIELANDFVHRWGALSKQRRALLGKQIPVAAIQVAALNHPDAEMRRLCLFLLDQYASDASSETFRRPCAIRLRLSARALFMESHVNGFSVVTLAPATRLRVRPMAIPILPFGMLPAPLRIAVNLTIVAAKRRCVTHGEHAG